VFLFLDRWNPSWEEPLSLSLYVCCPNITQRVGEKWEEVYIVYIHNVWSIWDVMCEMFGIMTWMNWRGRVYRNALLLHFINYFYYYIWIWIIHNYILLLFVVSIDYCFFLIKKYWYTQSVINLIIMNLWASHYKMK